jgi:hypothetical protein
VKYRPTGVIDSSRKYFSFTEYVLFYTVQVLKRLMMKGRRVKVKRKSESVIAKRRKTRKTKKRRRRSQQINK